MDFCVGTTTVPLGVTKTIPINTTLGLTNDPSPSENFCPRILFYYLRNMSIKKSIPPNTALIIATNFLGNYLNLIIFW